jgi:2-oxoisovalerate dehydrogenase E2 component (dihydrolipoyl transacylase)
MGDHVLADQPMVSVETAKAVVEVPVPFNGTVTALHGAVGDIVATGGPLIDLDSSTVLGTASVEGIDFDSSTIVGTVPIEGVDSDSGTVVGSMPATSEEEFVDSAIVGRPRHGDDLRTRAVPLARALAKRFGLDLAAVEGSGTDGLIRLDDVLAHANLGTLRSSTGGAAAVSTRGGNGAVPRARAKTGDAVGAVPRALAMTGDAVGAAPQALAATGPVVPAGATPSPLRGARRAMAHSMSMSRDQVSGSTVCDDADIHHWTRRGDYMLRLIRAMSAATEAEPALNAWYDAANNSRILFEHIDLGVAVDTSGGLIVPVLRDVRSKSPDELRAAIAAQKDAAHHRSTLPADLRDCTLMLSNFGTLAGRYGIPLVVPPAVAILGAGKVREDAVVVGGAVVAHRRMPLSLSFDHRCITGGEACRFLAAVIVDLEKPN